MEEEEERIGMRGEVVGVKEVGEAVVEVVEAVVAEVAEGMVDRHETKLLLVILGDTFKRLKSRCCHSGFSIATSFSVQD